MSDCWSNSDREVGKGGIEIAMSGSVWAESSHSCRELREYCHKSFISMPLQSARCDASSGSPQCWHWSVSHLPHLCIHLPTPRNQVESLEIKCFLLQGSPLRDSQWMLSMVRRSVFSLLSQYSLALAECTMLSICEKGLISFLLEYQIDQGSEGIR